MCTLKSMILVVILELIQDTYKTTLKLEKVVGRGGFVLTVHHYIPKCIPYA